MFRNKYLPGHWGMHGFNRHPSLRKVNVSINVSELTGLTDGDEVNLTEMGYDKLLGKGPISKPLKIIVDEASPRAIAKVEAAGGTVSTSSEDGEDWGEWEEE
jgi:large subunit ribosomal protein L15